VQAALRCTETLPTGQIVVASETDCPTRVLSSPRWFEAEFDLEIPLDAVPTMTFAGHDVTWTIVLLDTPQGGDGERCEHPVVVAPVVAAAVLQGDRTP
jgi:hypothetical protein